MSEAEMWAFQPVIDEWRLRLQDISWFMRGLNEEIARAANGEDGCTGRFWEGRFKSQALLDQAALIACMAYVDLNPVRAKMAKTPEKSHHTSVKKRCDKAQKSNQSNLISQQEKTLYPFVGNPRVNQPEGIQMRLSEYLGLEDATGRIIRNNKRGHISASAQSILKHLNINEDRWLHMTCKFEVCFSSFAGNERSIRIICNEFNYQRPLGLAVGKRMFH